LGRKCRRLILMSWSDKEPRRKMRATGPLCTTGQLEGRKNRGRHRRKTARDQVLDWELGKLKGPAWGHKPPKKNVPSGGTKWALKSGRERQTGGLKEKQGIRKALCQHGRLLAKSFRGVAWGGTVTLRCEQVDGGIRGPGGRNACGDDQMHQGKKTNEAVETTLKFVNLHRASLSRGIVV